MKKLLREEEEKIKTAATDGTLLQIIIKFVIVNSIYTFYVRENRLYQIMYCTLLGIFTPTPLTVASLE